MQFSSLCCTFYISLIKFRKFSAICFPEHFLNLYRISKNIKFTKKYHTINSNNFCKYVWKTCQRKTLLKKLMGKTLASKKKSTVLRFYIQQIFVWCYSSFYCFGFMQILYSFFSFLHIMKLISRLVVINFYCFFNVPLQFFLFLYAHK